MKHFLFIIAALVACINSEAQNITSDSVPVRVSYFTSTLKNNTTLLNWKVVCYLSYANFQVQRSSNGIDYTTINSFTADRIRCLSPFDFEDAFASARTYYRLKVGDKDGNFSTSKVLVAFGKEKSFEINSITPNLISSNTVLSISSADNDKAEILITGYQGHIVKRVNIQLSKGISDVKINLSDLPKGLYIIKVTNSLSEIRVSKIFKL